MARFDLTQARDEREFLGAGTAAAASAAGMTDYNVDVNT